MKKLVMFFGLMAFTLVAFAQEDDSYSTERPDEIQTLMGNNHAVGGYGAISIRYTEMDNQDAFVFGARGGMILGHMMALGLGGAGFFNDMHSEDPLQPDVSLAGGYGGFFFEPIIAPKFPVHVSFPILIGAGGVAVVTSNDDDSWDNYNNEASDAYMVIEPGIEVELNITHFFRFCVGGYYRYTSDVDIPEYDVPTNVLHGFSGGVTFKFGRF